MNDDPSKKECDTYDKAFQSDSDNDLPVPKNQVDLRKKLGDEEKEQRKAFIAIMATVALDAYMKKNRMK